MVAAIIDNAVWFIGFGWVIGALPRGTSTTTIGIVTLVFATAWFNYFAIAEWRFGQTIGKNALDMRVTTEDGQPLPYNTAAIRNLMRIVDSLAALLVFGLVLMNRSPRHQRFGDRVAHTVVVHAPKIPAAPPPPAQPAAMTSAEVFPEAAGALGPQTPSPADPPPGDPPPVPPPVADPTTETPPSDGETKSGGSRMVGLPAGTWSPRHVAWGVLAFIGLLLVEGALITPFDPHLHTLAAALLLQAALAATLAGVAFGFAAMPGGGFAEPWRLGLRSFRRSAIGWAALALLAYIVFAAIYAPLVQPHQEDVARDLGLGESAFGAIAAALMIIVVAPISEEIFFRGFVFGGLRRRLPLWAAALIAGSIFGIFHFTGVDSIGVVPQLAVLGTILAVLYEKTGSLWPPIMVHMVNNVLAFAYLASK